MNFYGRLPQSSISLNDGPSNDSFGRLRTSMPVTLFDSKLLDDNAPLFWDDKQVSGSGTTSTYTQNTASVRLAVSTAAGRRLRQTFQRFNYQPGKSFLVIATGVLNVSGGGTGITRRIGYYDDNNGLFFENRDGYYYIMERSYASGAPVDTAVSRSNWNIDPMDGTGPCRINLDFSKVQIFVIDFEWLGVGRVRYGYVIDGKAYFCHETNHANLSSNVYMSTPNLPLRYEIINNGSGVASSMDQICSTVIIEGGNQNTGIVRGASTNGTQVDADVADTVYAVIGLRKKTGYYAPVSPVQISMMSETADDFEWKLMLNPTVAGSFTYVDETNSAVQIARGATANVVSSGIYLQGGFSTSSSAISNVLETIQRLGTSISGVRDELVLCVRPLSNAADIQASLMWREGV